ncbi:hypothetical protein NGRA_0110 [Nosema granulosis]|uniref:Uncharacterized protein n=1 Tax=Nosema granulosis TaxID=83296 RepID=A0A9P6H0Y1_9MICR|nr:hypothetical protein NGRA_0110 [Nosema granulosis]
MVSKQVLDKNEVHIIPFNSKYYGPIEIEYCDLSADATTIRGVKVVKTNINLDVKIYNNQGEIKGSVYYWKIDSVCAEDKFQKGLRLIDEGLGFKERSRSILSYISRQ